MYCAHFGLHRPPFNNTPDPTFYLSTPEHEEALATLKYATTQRKGFVLVTGEIGAGKTLLARLFLRHMERAGDVAVISHTSLNGAQLLSAICSEFQLHPPAEANTLQLTERLHNFLLQQFARNRFVVVVVDEAQNLTDESFEELRMLGNLEADDAKLLQVCILGQPELAQRFRQPSLKQLDQRLFRRFHLPSLSRDLTHNYIAHRLKIAGCQREDLFTAAAIDVIHQASRGTPRLINQLCDNALLAAYAENAQQVDDAIVDRMIDREAGVGPSHDEAMQVPPVPGAAAPEQGDAEAVPPFTLLHKVSGDCLAIQQQLESLKLETASATAVDNLRQEHIEQARHLLRLVDQLRGDMQRLPEESQRRWEETRRQLNSLQSSTASQEVVDKLEHDFKAGIEQLSEQIDRQRRQLTDLADGLHEQCTAAAQQMAQVRSAGEQSAARLVDETDQKLARARQALEGRIAQCDQQVQDLARQVSDEFTAARDSLDRLGQQAASAADVDALRAEHQSAMQRLLDRFTAQADELAGLKSQLHEQGQAEHGAHRVALAKLGRSVVAEARRIRQLRHELMTHAARTDERLTELSRQFASRAEVDALKQTCLEGMDQLRSAQETGLDQLREVQHQQAKEMADRIDMDRRTLQRVISRISQRFRMTQKHIDSLASTSVDRDALQRVEQQSHEDATRLLQLLEQCSQATEQQFAEVASRLRQMDDSMADLQGKSASAAEVEQLTAQHEEQRQQLLAGLAAQRAEWTAVWNQVQSRCEQIEGQVRDLTADVVSTVAFDAVREQQDRQIRELGGDMTALRHQHEAQLSEITEAQRRDSAALAGRLTRNRQALKALIARIGERFQATQQQIANLTANSVTQDAFAQMQSDTRLETDQLLHQLENCNAAMEQQFSQVADRLSQMDRDFDDLRTRSATSEDLVRFRGQQQQERDAVLAELGSQRQEWGAVFQQVQAHCEDLDARLAALGTQAASASDVEALRGDYAEQIRSLHETIEQRKQHFEAALSRVAVHCNQTQEAVRKLAREAASNDALEELRRQHAHRLSEVTERLDAAASRHVEDVNVLAGELLTQQKQVIDLQASRQFKPVHVELTPAAATQLGELVTTAQEQGKHIARSLEQAEAVSRQMQETARQTETAVQQWRSDAELITQQAEQLRASAAVAERILKAMQSCHKVLDRKLNSSRWQSELARGEELAGRLEQATRQAGSASDRLTAALRNFEAVQEAEEDWSQRRQQVRDTTVQAQHATRQLSQLLAEARQTSGAIGRSLEKRKQMLQVVARGTGRLMKMLDGASQADEEIKPPTTTVQIPAPPRRPTRLVASRREPVKAPAPASKTA